MYPRQEPGLQCPARRAGTTGLGPLGAHPRSEEEKQQLPKLWLLPLHHSGVPSCAQVRPLMPTVMADTGLGPSPCALLVRGPGTGTLPSLQQRASSSLDAAQR